MQRVAVWSLTIVLAVVGLCLAWGGALLIGAGGSPYYLAAGAAVLASAFALVRRSGLAIVIYGVFLAATLAWSLRDIGLDGWGLAPRLLGPIIVGLLFLVPAAAAGGSPPRRWRAWPPSGWPEGSPSIRT
jgi:glucose dehydrogenase